LSPDNRFRLDRLLVLARGGGVFLDTGHTPPPTARVERTLPDDQFPR
jgi:hypothetical protein